ncbi:MAG TPA: hypothetical protein QF564_18830 [Pirellulaceae bacterium]|nr:hypothetical protein [Pirellulaceae bacterium]
MTVHVPTVNRFAAVVEPKEPYLAWARGLDDDDPQIDSMSREHLTSVYLIDDLDETGKVALRQHWSWIFQQKLMAWHRVERDWPRRRSYEMFHEWFDVRLRSTVFDLCDEPLLHRPE